MLSLILHSARFSLIFILFEHGCDVPAGYLGSESKYMYEGRSLCA